MEPPWFLVASKPPWFLVVNTTVVHTLRMSREDPQFKLRMTEDLKARIEDAAKANNRSMNAEIIARLEASFAEAAKGGKGNPPPIEETLMLQQAELVEKVKREFFENLQVALAGRQLYISDKVFELAKESEGKTDAERQATKTKAKSAIASFKHRSE
jgi:hypothetical protein